MVSSVSSDTPFLCFLRSNPIGRRIGTADQPFPAKSLSSNELTHQAGIIIPYFVGGNNKKPLLPEEQKRFLFWWTIRDAPAGGPTGLRSVGTDCSRPFLMGKKIPQQKLRYFFGYRLLF